jgi:flagellar FliL protein
LNATKGFETMAEIPVLEPAPAEKSSGKSKRKLIIIIGSAVVVLGAAAGGWFMLAQHKPHQAPQAEAAPHGPPVYVALDPPFVVNFEAQQLVRFLQVTVQLMSRDTPTVELLHANDPAIRNDLLLLFGNQRYEVIATREGKENLRKQALDVARHVVEQAGGKPDRVEAVYFTSFVMQ